MGDLSGEGQGLWRRVVAEQLALLALDEEVHLDPGQADGESPGGGSPIPPCRSSTSPMHWPVRAGTHRLQIVWFQDGWAPPIDPAVLEELTCLDFMAVAFDEMSTW
jgi:hypothetical protein